MGLIAWAEVKKKRRRTKAAQVVEIIRPDGKKIKLRSGDQIEVRIVYRNERERPAAQVSAGRFGFEPHPDFPHFLKHDETKWTWEIA